MGTIRFNKSDMTIEGGTKTEDPAKLAQLKWVDSPEIGISTGHDTDNLPDERQVLDGGEIRPATQPEIDAYKSNRVADRLVANKRMSKQLIEDRLIDMAIIRATHKRLNAIERATRITPMSFAVWRQSIRDEIDQA